MSKKLEKKNYNLKLYYISRLLHVYPLHFVFYSKTKINKLQYFTTTVLILSIIVIFIWNYNWRYIIHYKTVAVSYGAIDVTINLVLTMLNIVSVIITQSQGSQWEVLFKPLFNKTNEKANQNNYNFYCIHVISWILIVFEVYGLSKFGIYVVISTILMDQINFYILLVTSLLINNYANNFTDKILNLKMRLHKEVKLVKELKAFGKNDILVLEKFKSVSQADDILCFVVEILKGIEAFNNIYGIQILGISSVIMLYITNTINTVFYFVEYQKFNVELIFTKCYNSVMLLLSVSIRGLDKAAANPEGLAGRIYFFITTQATAVKTVFGLLIVSPCFEATKQFDEIIKVTCKFLIELPHGVEDPYYKLLKEKLVLLIKQLEFRKPYFSAAGFFEVNYSMFMYIFAGITSFVVVYVQLQN